MPRAKRNFQPDYSYHITVRCNNREFNLASRPAREVFLYSIKKAQAKYPFKLYGLCIMYNHVHYLLEPEIPEDVPKIMHWLNWYTAMCFNTMLRRKGHFWEQRYYCDGFPNEDKQRALNTLRYIHANPKAASMRHSWFYDFSNYGSYVNSTNDGITQWHPAFLELGTTLDECAKSYKGFCTRYRTKKKQQEYNSWGKKLLQRVFPAKKNKSQAPGQMSLAFSSVEKIATVTNSIIAEIAQTFILANCYIVNTVKPF